jgi:nucleoside-diphosphate-sugar epimerase
MTAMRTPAILITGAAGEIGHELIEHLSGGSTLPIVTLDLAPLDPRLAHLVHREIRGSILDASLVERLLAEYEIDRIFHLAALLSTRSEFSPMAAHQVNVGGTLALLEFAQHQAESHGRPVLFLYPSSVAVYGLPTLDVKRKSGAVSEDRWTTPTTMYGCNKLYCEQLGRYYAEHYKQLSVVRPAHGVDFRAVRFPGLISATTVPSGGTSDYASEMVHAAARGRAYSCFVSQATRMPIMAMPDAIDALVLLASAPRAALSRTAYNVRAFSASAGEMQDEVTRAFPEAEISYAIDDRRQSIVDSWPEDLDDSAARKDWRFSPQLDLQNAFRHYLIPEIRRGVNDL